MGILFENTKTYILIPKVHENIEKYENQIRYKDFRSFSLFLRPEGQSVALHSLFSELKKYQKILFTLNALYHMVLRVNVKGCF